jgi:hypothetical protein
MPIEVLDLRRERTDLLSVAIDLVNSAQDQYYVSLLDVTKSYDLLFSVHDDTDIGAFIPQLWGRKLEWRGFHPFLLCVFDTAISLEDKHNLFSVDTADQGFAAVTVHNVATVLIPSEQMTAYVIFQLAFFALKFSGCNIDFHEEDRGCLALDPARSHTGAGQPDDPGPPNQTCFCGQSRSATIARRRARSAASTVKAIPVRIPQTRTLSEPRESPVGAHR